MEVERYPLISVIVPIYGVERFLDQCIESIVQQTYKNLEILLIDDGSKDRCPAIVDSWAQKDGRIVPIHKENGGQSSARNIGLMKAQGEYISFVDGDDWLEVDAIENLFNGFRKFDTDITVGSVKQIKNGVHLFSKFIISSKFQYVHCTCKDAFDFFLRENIAVMAKLYKSDVVKEICFPEGRKAEEYIFLCKIINNVRSVVFCNAEVYNYVIRDDSDSHGIKPSYLMDCIEAFVEIYPICERNHPTSVDFCQKRLTELVFEFESSQCFCRQGKQKRENVLHKAHDIVGEYRALKVSLEVVAYTYIQFFGFLAADERKYLQDYFRQEWKKADKKKKIKYSLAFISLRIYKAILGVYRSIKQWKK